MYRIFLSSPGDVLPERNRAQAVIDRLNAEHPGEALFSLTRWERSYYTATGPFQDQIVSPGEHDLVVFIFWKRLGTDLPPRYNRPDGSARTGTEYEFEDARDARDRRTDELPDILVYRKTAKVTFSEEALDVERAQKKALDQFWERWFRSDTGHLIAGFQSFPDIDDFEQQFARNLREWLNRRHSGQVLWNIARHGSPYRGLVPFEEKYASLFFGRDADISRARARFIEAAIGQEIGRRGSPFLLILGASGSGKSSLLRAGLVPRMRAAGVPAFLEDGSDTIHAFQNLTLTPREMGEDLCLGLAAALYRPGAPAESSEAGLPQLVDGDYPTPETFAALAATGHEFAAAPILRALDRAGAETAGIGKTGGSPRRFGLLIAIDQMEELFARSETDRRTFLRLLISLVRTGRVWVVGTMRNDFYDRLRQDADLSALADSGRLYDLAPPSGADYRDIIRKPAQAAGLEFETSVHRDLAAEIEAEAASEGALPMVAFLLEQLFRERRGNLLTLETYDRLGGAAGALAQYGDQVIAGLTPIVQEAFPRVVRRLVRKGLQDLVPTATSAPLGAFPNGSAERQLIDALSDGRLVRMFTVSSTGANAANAWVRWSHEALLARWPRLRNSVDADRRDYETLDRTQNAYSLWQGTPAAQKSERLLSDLALAEAEDLVERWGSDVDEPLRQFVQTSQAHAQARRHRRRRVVTATVGALSLLLALAIVAGFIALKQRNLALMEQAAADRTARFMVSLFKIADPGENHGNSVTVREVLDRGATDVNKGLEHEPTIRADLLTAMGQAYSGLGLYDHAKKLLADARTAQSGVGVPAESRVRTLVALGSTYYLAADYDDSGKVLEEAVALARRTLRADDILRSEALADLADLRVQQGKYSEAEQLCLEALRADRQRGPDQAAVLARTLDTLGSVYFFNGDLPAAEATMREALALHEQASGSKHTMTAQAMSNLASVLYQSGRYDEALAMYQRALPIYTELYGTEHPEVAALDINIASAALMVGRIDEAEPMLRQALRIDEKLKGPTHDDLVPPLNRIGMIDAYAGRMLDAGKEIHRAEAIARLPDHGALLDQVLINVAELALKEGDGNRAAESLAESRRLLEAAFPLTEHPTEAWRYAIWDTVNAELLAHQGDAPTARSAIASALPIIAKRFGPNGFYSLLARQRVQFVEQTLAEKSRNHGRPPQSSDRGGAPNDFRQRPGTAASANFLAKGVGIDQLCREWPLELREISAS
jgi:tetratricopeptide (TPR) repeat protein